MNLVIVESPAKAKTINKYLGSEYQVIASCGHVRDLAAKNGSVEPDNDFAMTWEVNEKSRKHLKSIVTAAKKAERLILATDPDREGEAISWHVLEILQQEYGLKNIKVERVVFNAVTKSAILQAMKQPRQIDIALVEAYLARRALDYLVGFTLSPVLWRKLPAARSAGRVQSVTLRILCEREQEIESFITEEYWSLFANFIASPDKRFKARVVFADSEKLDRLSIKTQEQAEAIHQSVEKGHFKVRHIGIKPQKRNPYPPFTTSTMQQDAARRLGISASRVMQTAQRLYEGIEIGNETQGLITYMRTDGVQITPEAIESCRHFIATAHGNRYLPSSPRIYKTKAKNAQEAHEAIRPTCLETTPKDIEKYLNNEEAALYKLIWERAVASQMASAEFLRTTIEIDGIGGDGKTYGLRATGSVLKFDGFLTLYQTESKEQEQSEDEDIKLPDIKLDDSLTIENVESHQHFTEPPPRYSESKLIRKMEEIGIGRPSTYAATLSVLNEREYVRTEKKQLVPEDKGRLVIAFLESFFKRYVEYDFTADLETKLDLVSNGTIEWKVLLSDFWLAFNNTVEKTKKISTSEILEAVNDLLAPYIFPPSQDGVDPRKCPSCTDGKLVLKTSRHGVFIGCSNYPDCRHTREFSSDVKNATPGSQIEDRSLGIDSETKQEIYLKNGRFGPYVEQTNPENEKPNRMSIPIGISPSDVDLSYALLLLSLPREVGLHPETGKPISSGIGRYGPFLLHNGIYTNLENLEDVFTIGLNHAIVLLTEHQAKRGKGAGPEPLKTLGDHPEHGGLIYVMDGRYGPYVKHKKVNATLPRDMTPETVNLEQAIELIDAKAKKKTTKKKAGTKKKAPKEKKTKTKVDKKEKT
ncbi:MAG: type I DNA topoisomerase [Alphaproteobacteria bacterium]|nr:type I DNA topoisomerase [Alphaproteobacteria bacterium]